MASRGSQILPMREDDVAPLTRHTLGSSLELSKPNGPGRQAGFTFSQEIFLLKVFENTIIWASNIKSYDEVLRYIHEKVRYEFQTKDGQGWKTCILHNEQSLRTTTDGGLTKFASVKTWSLTRRFSMRQSDAFRSLKNDCTKLRHHRMSWIVSKGRRNAAN